MNQNPMSSTQYGSTGNQCRNASNFDAYDNHS
eukprot:CAMPEP_0184866780 /NCGR_PEP_ID=MMETSP0580-20130426/23682_1 /TAXON_ID=1118495 /ORGANISM="Dactyliosolen fragilissimus" /LENGTH=31 /DNA_ID= /DNA_START= /DNA_END= /DNA_ORIENTATION=